MRTFLNFFLLLSYTGPCHYEIDFKQNSWIKKSFNSGSFLPDFNTRHDSFNRHEDVINGVDTVISDAKVCAHISRKDDNTILALVTATQDTNFSIAKSKQLRLQHLQSNLNNNNNSSPEINGTNQTEKQILTDNNSCDPETVDNKHKTESSRPNISKKELADIRHILKKITTKVL